MPHRRRTCCLATAIASGLAGTPAFAQIQPSLIIDAPNASQEFGVAFIAVSGSRILVGDSGAESVLGNRGVVSVFDATTGAITGTFTDVPNHPTEDFGRLLAIEGDAAAVVSLENNDFRRDVYTIDLSTNTVGPILNPIDVGDVVGTRFARSGGASTDRGILAIGDSGYRIDESDTIGAIHLFDLEGRAPLTTIRPPADLPGETITGFGETLDLLGNRVITSVSRPFEPDEILILDARSGAVIRSLDLPERVRLSSVLSQAFELTNDHVIFVSGLGPIGPGVYVFDSASGGLRGVLSRDRPLPLDWIAVEGETLATGTSLRTTPDAFVQALNLYHEPTGIRIGAVDAPAGTTFLGPVDIDGDVLVATTFSLDPDSASPFRVLAYDISALSHPCNAADQAAPFGLHNVADVDAFIANFTGDLVPGDLSAPFGVRDLSDIDAFVDAFIAGCG